MLIFLSANVTVCEGIYIIIMNEGQESILISSHLVQFISTQNQM